MKWEKYPADSKSNFCLLWASIWLTLVYGFYAIISDSEYIYEGGDEGLGFILTYVTSFSARQTFLFWYITMLYRAFRCLIPFHNEIGSFLYINQVIIFHSARFIAIIIVFPIGFLFLEIYSAVHYYCPEKNTKEKDFDSK